MRIIPVDFSNSFIDRFANQCQLLFYQSILLLDLPFPKLCIVNRIEEAVKFVKNVGDILISSSFAKRNMSSGNLV